MTESEKQMLVSEVNLLRELRHSNIVRYYDRIIDRIKATIYIVMEHCEKGDLSNIISKHKRERYEIFSYCRGRKISVTKSHNNGQLLDTPSVYQQSSCFNWTWKHFRVNEKAVISCKWFIANRA